MKNNKLIYLSSFFSGFLSLSQEILWMRLISFAGMSVPQTFSYTLALFLIGISIGAQIGKSICKKNQSVQTHTLGKIFILSSLIDILLLISVYAISKFFGISILFLGLCVFICATIRGIIFPLVHHVGTYQVKTGAQISNVYFSNVLGSALSPILISFVILDFLNTQQTYLLVCTLTFIIAALCLDSFKLKLSSATLGIITLLLIFTPEKIFHELSKKDWSENPYPTQILENKHGFIQVYESENEHIVFGGNVYDGKFNTDIFHNTNGIDRAYFLASTKPDAKNILVIGLSTGSWAKVLSALPSFNKMTIIEINPAYVELIKKDPIVADLLKDERVEIVFDDGRKWLKNHQNQKFDMVLMNTTWHWRAYSSNLLSKDFLEIISKSTTDDAVVFYNTTASLDAYHTAHQVFPHVYQYKFFILASKNPYNISQKNIEDNLCLLKNHINQKPIFTNREACHLATQEIIKNPLTPYENMDLLSRPLEVITDDNMITEYKYGSGL